MERKGLAPASGDTSWRLLLRRPSCQNHGTCLDVFCSVPGSQPGAVTLARVLISTKSRYIEFCRGSHSSDQTRFCKAAFSGWNRNNSNNSQTKTNRLMTIIEIWPNKFSNQNFVHFLLPPKSQMSPFRLISLKYINLMKVCDFCHKQMILDEPLGMVDRD